MHELLDIADIKVNGSRSFDITVRNPDFYKRVLREGSLGLGEGCMNGWWECDLLDCLFHRILRSELEEKASHHFKDILCIVATRLINLQSRKRV
ncbi:MAG: hypothetical protein ACSLEN_08860 [Candidatus Malihini olakiniferum]